MPRSSDLIDLAIKSMNYSDKKILINAGDSLGRRTFAGRRLIDSADSVMLEIPETVTRP